MSTKYTAQQKRESDRFDQWWRTQDWDGAYMDVAWDAWWEAVRDATDEEVIEVLLPASRQELDALRAELREKNDGWIETIRELELSQAENEQLRAKLTRWEAIDLGKIDAITDLRAESERRYELGLAMAEQVAELGAENERLRAAMQQAMALIADQDASAAHKALRAAFGTDKRA